MFFRCGFIEAWGRGIEKICEACDKSGNSYPEFNVSDFGFVVKFDALKSALIEYGNKEKTIKLEGLENEIYQIIKYNPYVTRAEIAKKTGKNVKTIARYLKSMSNIIRYIGSSKSGMWIITSNDKIE